MRTSAIIVTAILAAAILAGCATAPTTGDLTGRLTDKERELCIRGGGCHLVTRAALEDLKQRAYSAGVEAASETNRNKL
jgi:uncharacterized lipoprotein YajG